MNFTFLTTRKIVCDPGILACGIAAAAQESLINAGLDALIFDKVSYDDVAAIYREVL
jgi:alcohol dehydrogenase class IV